MAKSSCCFCIGPQNGEPYCPCEMRSRGIFQRDGKWIEPEKVVGAVRKSPFDDLIKDNIYTKKDIKCTDPNHNPPMHLYVAPGETYLHTCPSCGELMAITNNITFSEVEDEDAFAAESDDEILDLLGR